MSSNQMINVRVFPGACVTHFYNFLEPLMERKPSKVIIHMGTNDAVEKDADHLLNELLNLKNDEVTILSYVTSRLHKSEKDSG